MSFLDRIRTNLARREVIYDLVDAQAWRRAAMARRAGYLRRSAIEKAREALQQARLADERARQRGWRLP